MAKDYNLMLRLSHDVMQIVTAAVYAIPGSDRIGVSFEVDLDSNYVRVLLGYAHRGRVDQWSHMWDIYMLMALGENMRRRVEDNTREAVRRVMILA